MKVKICGLTRPEDAVTAEEAGAAFLGTILAGGPRLVSLEQAARVLGAPRAGIQRAAVFGEQSSAEIIDIAAQLSLDVLQLHHAPTANHVRELRRATGRTVWPVLRVAGHALPKEADALTAAADALVLDAMVVGQLGGTGVALDWSALAADLAAWRARFPDATLVLAGGLRPGNVQEAIRLLSPTVVDVSSGVERAPGVKDPALVHQFVEAAHGAAESSR
ncbi:MAG: phosphoribosylanthranilate isomerase [Gemmatimonadaceae bacterium]|nr:phosphoribosylanthranilate isomerase [Gemmatimonadaceae bacterium]